MNKPNAPKKSHDSWPTRLAVWLTAALPVVLYLVALRGFKTPNGTPINAFYLMATYALCGSIWWALAMPTVRDEVRLWVGDPIDGAGRPRLALRSVGNIIAGVVLVALARFFSLDGPYMWPAYLQAALGLMLLMLGLTRRL